MLFVESYKANSSQSHLMSYLSKGSNNLEVFALISNRKGLSYILFGGYIRSSRI